MKMIIEEVDVLNVKNCLEESGILIDVIEATEEGIKFDNLGTL